MNSQKLFLKIAKLLMIIPIAFACPNDPLCMVCVNGVCAYCVYSFPNAQGVCQAPKTIIPGCYSYTGETTCLDCQNGYYQNLNPITSATTCTVLDSSISNFCTFSYSSPKTCTHCSFNVLALGGGCNPNNRCADPNCDVCYYDPKTGNQSCWLCNSEFYLWIGVTPGICIPRGNIIGCYLSSSLIKCDECNAGFYNQNGVCIENSGTNYGSASQLAVSGFLMLFLATFMKH